MQEKDFGKIMSEYTDRSLIDIVTRLRPDHETDAILAAENELKRRGLWRKNFEYFQPKPTDSNDTDIYDPKKDWKIIRSGLILFGIIHFLLEVVYSIDAGIKITPIAPVIFNYLISSWWIKSKTNGRRINKPFQYSLYVSSIVFGIRLILAFIIGLLFQYNLASSSISKQDGWNEEAEKSVTTTLTKSADSLGLSNEDKNLYADYILKNLKVKYPNGIQSVNSDSLRKTSYNLGRKAAEDLNLTMRWTPFIVSVFRKKLLKMEGMELLEEAKRIELANCIIEKVKIEYPEGLNFISSDSVLNPIIQECVTSLD
jgi:hypothetical protein